MTADALLTRVAVAVTTTGGEALVIDDRLPPISWCRIFQAGPPCGRLCEDCQATLNSLTRDEKRGLIQRNRRTLQ